METFRRNLEISRAIGRVAATLAAVWYYVLVAPTVLLGRRFKALFALRVRERLDAVVEARGVRFVCTNGDYYLRAKYTYDKERETVEWIDGFPAASVLWDIGANVGAFALYAGARGHRVVAFEPQPMNYAALTVNIGENGLLEQVAALNVALYSEAKVARLHGIDSAAGAAMSVFDRRVEDVHGVLQTRHAFTAISLRADELTRQFAVAMPNFIKLDVDGNELDILKGARELLRNPGLRGIAVELDRKQSDYAAICETLEENGFRVATRRSHGTVDNVTFVR